MRFKGYYDLHPLADECPESDRKYRQEREPIEPVEGKASHLHQNYEGGGQRIGRCLAGVTLVNACRTGQPASMFAGQDTYGTGISSSWRPSGHNPQERASVSIGITLGDESCAHACPLSNDCIITSLEAKNVTLLYWIMAHNASGLVSGKL